MWWSLLLLSRSVDRWLLSLVIVDRWLLSLFSRSKVVVVVVVIAVGNAESNLVLALLVSLLLSA